MSLKDWEANGWLRAHQSSREEVAGLLAIVDRDIAAADLEALDDDWRFNIAYNAILQCALAALAVAGYRPEKGGGNHHYRALQSLELTLGIPAKRVVVIEAYRKKRNQLEYERSGVASSEDVKAACALARELAKQTKEWIAISHPDLV